MKVLITGASGNLGSKATRHLDKRDDVTLVLLDRNTNEERIHPAALEQVDPAWSAAFRDVHTVFHFAGEPHVGANWPSLQRNNIDTLLNVLDASVEHGVKRFVFASSLHAVLGHNNNAPCDNRDPATNLDSFYGVSKAVGERIALNYSVRCKLSVICLQIGFIPPGDNPPPIWHHSFRAQQRWLSNGDFYRAVDAALDAEQVEFAVVQITSRIAGNRWDIDTARQLIGYEPLDQLVPKPRSLARRVTNELQRRSRRATQLILAHIGRR